jgi:nucleotide-binding universal stress UspA family protein
MGGTVVCDVTDAPAGRSAAEFATALGARLGLRVVLVCVGSDAARRLDALAGQLALHTETRVAFGDHAEALARVAAEEGADVIIVGARPTGIRGRSLRWSLARELEAATPIPVLVAPPATRRRSNRRLAAETR